MPGIRISALPGIVTPAYTDIFPVVQAGVSYKESFVQFQDLFAISGVNTNITSMTGLTGVLQAPTSINDTNGNKVLSFGSSASAVNYYNVTNSATGANAYISVMGADADLPFFAVSKGDSGLVVYTQTIVNPTVSFFSGTSYQHRTDFTFTNSSGTRTVAFQDASGTVAYLSNIPAGSPSALTKTDDTNVTLTLGGTPATALLQATSLTLGWTGTLSGTRGGTGVNNGARTITVGGNYTMSGAFSFTGTLTNTTTVTFPTSGTLATTSQLVTPAALTKTDDTNVTLTLGGSPSTALVNAASLTLGWTGTLAVGRGGLGIASTPSNGQIPIGNGTNYVAATLTAGTGVSISNGSGSISISSTGIGSLVWNDVSGITQSAAVNNGYIISNASQTTVTLPATVAVGSVFAVQGKGAAGWILQMNTGQTCHFGSSATSSAGTLTSTNLWDSVTIVCVTANTTFAVTSSIGTLTVA